MNNSTPTIGALPEDRGKAFEALRLRYPEFYYRDVELEWGKASLTCLFNYECPPDLSFTSKFVIPLPTEQSSIDKERISGLISQLGIVELASYWKSVCSPVVHIAPVHLGDKQKLWWQKLFYLGLGEFRYLNELSTKEKDFVLFETLQKVAKLPPHTTALDGFLVPIGGGKDSVVSLEMLKASSYKTTCFALNPRDAVKRSILQAGSTLEQSIFVTRELDSRLFELNKQGFLNGHTPFSAIIAFLSIIVGELHGIEFVALSNESSANEGNLTGENINHQYSKSWDFEDDFRTYVSDYLGSKVSYFSLLRPLNELQISGLFSQLPQHHDSFRSCNVGSKTDAWCGTCPKCIFVSIMLAPFLGTKRVEQILGSAVFSNSSLDTTLLELIGLGKTKPFECVGTSEEVRAAIKEIIANEDAPNLLNKLPIDSFKNQPFEELLRAFSKPHAVPNNLVPLLNDFCRSAFSSATD
jgi:hypothetical protein